MYHILSLYSAYSNNKTRTRTISLEWIQEEGSPYGDLARERGTSPPCTHLYISIITSRSLLSKPTFQCLTRGVNYQLARINTSTLDDACRRVDKIGIVVERGVGGGGGWRGSADENHK